MKDSKQVRSEYHSFVESYSNISALSLEEAKKAEMEKKKSYKKEEEEDDDDECTCEKVLMRKTGAFTELAERYQMSVKQFARFVENNQGLFDIETRKKAILANKFSGFKESVEWDQFFGDLELVEVQEGMGVVTGTAKAINAVMKSPKQTPAQEKKAVRDLTKTMDVVAKPVKSFLSVGDKKNQEMMNKRRPAAEEIEVEGENLHEIQTKETASGTKYKVRVKEKDSGSSYIRYATREKIAQLRADPKIASVEMTDEGEAPEDRGEKKAQAKGGGLAVKAKKELEKKKTVAAGKKKRSVTTEALDPVGKEDGDIDNDGDTDKSDEYLHKRRKAIGKAMKKRMKEGFSNWREDLKEITDIQDTKKIKGGKVNNKVVINPSMGEGFDPQKIAEGLGAEVISCEEIDEAIEGGPILPGEKGKRIYPKGQEPKPTGAKLPPLQKAGYEPTGRTISEREFDEPGEEDWRPDVRLHNKLYNKPTQKKPSNDPKKPGPGSGRMQNAGYEPEGEVIEQLDPDFTGGTYRDFQKLHKINNMMKNMTPAQQKKYLDNLPRVGPDGKPLKGASLGTRSKVQNAGYEPEGEQIDEKKLTEPEMKKREEVVKSMKKGKEGFKKRYGERWKEVMYATATKTAKKKA